VSLAANGLRWIALQAASDQILAAQDEIILGILRDQFPACADLYF
jgi:hypothetical protein